jgi:hypothetical protein
LKIDAAIWTALRSNWKASSKKSDVVNPIYEFTLRFTIKYPITEVGSVHLNVGFNIDGGDGQIVFDSSSTAVCTGAALLQVSAANYPNFTIHYIPFPGPNSNSVARYLGSTGEFYPSPPFGASGWYFPIESLL